MRRLRERRRPRSAAAARSAKGTGPLNTPPSRVIRPLEPRFSGSIAGQSGQIRGKVRISRSTCAAMAPSWKHIFGSNVSWDEVRGDQDEDFVSVWEMRLMRSWICKYQFDSTELLLRSSGKKWGRTWKVRVFGGSPGTAEAFESGFAMGDLSQKRKPMCYG